MLQWDYKDRIPTFSLYKNLKEIIHLLKGKQPLYELEADNDIIKIDHRWEWFLDDV